MSGRNLPLRHHDRLAEILRFLVAGGGGFLLELVLLYAMTDGLGLHYLVSSGLAFVVGVIVNYLLCRFWVFRGAGRQSAASMLVFAGSSVAGLGIHQLCMWALVDFTGLHYLYAKVGAAAVVTLWNFALKRYALTKM